MHKKRINRPGRRLRNSFIPRVNFYDLGSRYTYIGIHVYGNEEAHAKWKERNICQARYRASRHFLSLYVTNFLVISSSSLLFSLHALSSFSFIPSTIIRPTSSVKSLASAPYLSLGSLAAPIYKVIALKIEFQLLWAMLFYFQSIEIKCTYQYSSIGNMNTFCESFTSK